MRLTSTYFIQKKPDFSELDKICEDFEKDILEAQEIDRQKIAEALRK